MQLSASRICTLTCVLALAFALTAMAQNSAAPSPEAAAATATTTTSQFVFVPLGDNTSFGATTRRMSEFRINPSTGALTVVNKGLKAQNVVAFSFRDPKGRFLYIQGHVPGSNVSSDIAEYRVNSTTGAITALPGSPFGATLNQQLFTGVIRPDLKFAYLLDATSVNILHIVSMNPSTGAMVKEVSQFNIPGTGTFLFDMHFDPTGKFLYVAEGEAGTIDAFVSNAATGALTQVRGSPFVPRGSVSGTCSPRVNFCGGSVAISGNHHLYYVSSLFDGVAEFQVNPTTGALTEMPGSPVAIPTHEGLGVRIAPNGKHLYVNAPRENSVVAYTINTTTGKLTKVTGSPFKVSGENDFMDIDETGKFLYTTSGNTVTGFHINSTTGVLTRVPGSPFSAPGNTGLTIVH